MFGVYWNGDTKERVSVRARTGMFVPQVQPLLWDARVVHGDIMTPRQRVLKRIADARAAIQATIELYYKRMQVDGKPLDNTWITLKRDDLAALRYLVRKAKEGR